MSVRDLFGGVSAPDDGERAEDDFYETPAFMTRSLLVHQPEIRGAVVLECASGRDAITRVLVREGGCRVLTNDIGVALPSHFHYDATRPTLWLQMKEHQIRWVISNFPFSVAFDILQHAVEHVPNVAVLLRKTFTEPTEARGEWLAKHPPTRVIGLPRHKFRGGSSDSVSVDWHIWQRWPDRALPPFVIDHLAKARRTPIA